MSRRRVDAPSVWAAKLASLFAQEMGLPAGNLWEPPVCRRIQQWIADTGDHPSSRAAIEQMFRVRLGLEAVA